MQESLKLYIKKRILFKDDDYYKDLILDDFLIEKTGDFEFRSFKKEMESKNIILEEKQYYDLKFKVNSDSYKIWKLYVDKNGKFDIEDVKALSLPVMARDNFINAMQDVGINGAMQRYRLFNRGIYHTIARYHDTGTLERVREVLIEFEVYRQKVGIGFTWEEMLDSDEVKAFSFIRKTRVKKTAPNDPACFDGNCLEKNILNGKIAIFGREAR